MSSRAEREALSQLAINILPACLNLRQTSMATLMIGEAILGRILETLKAENHQGIPVAVGKIDARREQPAIGEEFLARGFSIVGPWQQIEISPDNPDLGENIEFTPELFRGVRLQVGRKIGGRTREEHTCSYDLNRFPDVTIQIRSDLCPQPYNDSEFNAKLLRFNAPEARMWGKLPPRLTLTRGANGVIGMTTAMVYQKTHKTEDPRISRQLIAYDDPERHKIITITPTPDQIRELTKGGVEFGVRKVLAEIPPYEK